MLIPTDKNIFLMKAIGMAGGRESFRESIGISRSTLYRWEKDPSIIPLGLAAKISKRYNIIIDLFKTIKSL